MIDSQDEIRRLKRRLERERSARQQAEKLLEEKSSELYQANQELRHLADSLEEKIQQRTQELVGHDLEELKNIRLMNSPITLS